MDLPGRAVLHRQHHAPLHHQRGPLPQPTLSHEVRPQQDSQKSHAQDCVRVAVVDRHESTSLFDVLSGTVPFLFADTFQSGFVPKIYNLTLDMVVYIVIGYEKEAESSYFYFILPS